MQHFLLNETIQADHHTLIKRMLGKWIIQSTQYSLANNQVKNSMCQTKWLLAQNNYSDFEVIINKLYHKNKNKDSKLHIVAEIKEHNLLKIYHFFLLNDDLKQGYMIKIGSDFKVLQQYKIQYYSNNHICIHHKDKKNNEIIEKMYFLNNNLKIIKSIVQKNQKYAGVCFSSEIRIG